MFNSDVKLPECMYASEIYQPEPIELGAICPA